MKGWGRAEINKRLELGVNISLQSGLGRIPIIGYAVFTRLQILLESGVGITKSLGFAYSLPFNKAIITISVADCWDNAIVAF